MSQDIVADALNQIMNSNRAGKKNVEISRYSKFLLSILAIAKLKGYVKSYKTEGNKLLVEIGVLNGCSSIKPRFLIPIKNVERYVSRYLPARDLGVLIISTSQGLMTHQTAQEKNIGGSLVAYFY